MSSYKIKGGAKVKDCVVLKDPCGSLAGTERKNYDENAEKPVNITKMGSSMKRNYQPREKGTCKVVGMRVRTERKKKKKRNKGHF